MSAGKSFLITGLAVAIGALAWGHAQAATQAQGPTTTAVSAATTSGNPTDTSGGPQTHQGLQNAKKVMKAKMDRDKKMRGIKGIKEEALKHKKPDQAAN